jgi:nitroreductase / dihydropteridine reductase
MTNNHFTEALEWRYATKKMNGQTVPEDKIERILEAVRLSPSSMGMTPYTIFVVKDPAVKKELLPHCYNQSQITDSSALLVFAAWKNLSSTHVEEYMNEIASVRNIPVESLKDFAGSINGKIKNSTPQELETWAIKQTYIALGFGLAAAAVERVDSTPMEGYVPAGVDQVLGLDKKGMTAGCILALGYRDEENDFLAKAKKVRRKKEELFQEI